MAGVRAATAGVMQYQTRGDTGRVVQKVRGTLCAPHMAGDRIRAYLARHCKVGSAKVLGRIAPKGGPAVLWARGNSESEVKHKTHRSTANDGGEVLKRRRT